MNFSARGNNRAPTPDEETMIEIASQLSLMESIQQPLTISDQLELSEKMQFIESVYNSRILSSDDFESRGIKSGYNSERPVNLGTLPIPKQSSSPSSSIDGKPLSNKVNHANKTTSDSHFNSPVYENNAYRRQSNTSNLVLGSDSNMGQATTSASENKISDVLAAVSSKLVFFQQKIVHAIETFPDVSISN